MIYTCSFGESRYFLHLRFNSLSWTFLWKWTESTQKTTQLNGPTECNFQSCIVGVLPGKTWLLWKWNVTKRSNLNEIYWISCVLVLQSRMKILCTVLNVRICLQYILLIWETLVLSFILTSNFILQSQLIYFILFVPSWFLNIIFLPILDKKLFVYLQITSALQKTVNWLQ